MKKSKVRPSKKAADQQAKGPIWQIVLTVLLALAGQAMFVTKRPLAGLGLTLGAILPLLFYFKVLKIEGLRLGAAIFVLAALALAAFGASVVKASPGLGLLGFTLSGLALVVSGRSSGFLQAFELPRHSERARLWEYAFIALFVLAAGAVRFSHLSEYPTGAHGHEGEMVGRALALGNDPYTPHVSDGDILWPSLIFYQGLAAVKLLGFDAGHFRLPGAIWSLLSLVLFYFLARRLTSASSAAIAAVLYAGTAFHVGQSRNFFPGSILFVSPLLGLYGLLMGRLKNSLMWYAIGGFGLALSLHGFVPGRPLFAFFAMWLAWLWLWRRSETPKWKGVVVFWAVFLFVAGPVIVWALGNWDHYNHYVKNHNPYGGGGVMRYVQGALTEFPTYARSFHVVGDTGTTDTVLGRPFLDPVSGALFAAGFFAMIFQMWRPLPSFTLGLFLVALLPALLGGGFQHPTARRLVMVMPAAFLMVAYALEGFKRGLELFTQSRAAKWALGIAAMALAVNSAIVETRAYFAFMNQPEIKGGFYYSGYLAGKESVAYPKHAKIMTVTLAGPGPIRMLIPPNLSADTVCKSLEEIFQMPAGRDYLLMLDPYLESAEGLFKRAFPNCDIKYFREEKRVANNYSDPYNPYTYLMRVLIPAADVADFRGLILKEGTAQKRLRVFDSDGINLLQGKRAVLSGTLLGGLRESKLRFGLPWPGWQLKLDGAPRLMNTVISTDGGAHYFEISGTLPAGASGALPLKVENDGIDLRGAGKLMAMPPGGMRSVFFDKEKTWDQKAVFTRRELWPLRRYYDYTELTLPYSVRFIGKINPDGEGPWEFHCGEAARAGGRIKVGSKLVFDSTSDREKPLITPIPFKKGKAQDFVVDYMVDPTVAERRTQVIYVRKSGESEWRFLPGEWVTPW